MKKLFPVLLLILAGCVGGPPKDYYNPKISDAPKYKGPVTIEVVDDIESTTKQNVGDGYKVIGTSVYTGDQPKAVELSVQAKRVNASKVIYHLTPPAPGSWHVQWGLFGGGSGGYGVNIVFLGK
jgi:hypothetical protein